MWTTWMCRPKHLFLLLQDYSILEHDDANRALMGSNMQRQGVPLLAVRGAIRWNGD